MAVVETRFTSGVRKVLYLVLAASSYIAEALLKISAAEAADVNLKRACIAYRFG